MGLVANPALRLAWLGRANLLAAGRDRALELAEELDLRPLAAAWRQAVSALRA